MPYKHFLKEWLGAKVVDHEVEYAPISGTPQGGIISPHLANLTLSGLEETVKGALPRTRSNWNSHKTLRKVNIVRYADDFVITCITREDATVLIKTVDEFLKERGLKLNKDKTKITSVYEGFKFLGFRFKVYKGKGLLVTPSPEAKLTFRQRIRELMNKNYNVLPGVLIKELNPVILG